MKNITVSLDDETYRRARIWAAERGVSVTAVVKCILTTLPIRSQAKTPSPSPAHGSESATAADPGPDSGPGNLHASADTNPEPNKNTVTIPTWGLSVLRASTNYTRNYIK
jgi:hypothetical protein